MPRLRAALLASAALGIPSSLPAQTTLTLDQAVANAVSGNRALLADHSRVREAELGVQEAKSSYFPRLTVGESWQRSNQPVFVFSSLLSSREFAASNFAIDALNHPDPLPFFRTSVGVEQLLYDGGRMRSEASAAALRRDALSHQSDQASADLALAVSQTYGRVLAAQAAGRAAAAGVEAAREDLTRAERRRDVGMATDADVLSLRVHLTELEQRQIEAGGEAAIARAELNRLMGASLDRAYDVVEPQLEADSRQPIDTAAFVREALASRPSLKSQEAKTRLADTLRAESHSGLIPRIAVQGGVDVSGTSFGDRTSAWAVGGELRWTFSTGGAEIARIKSAAEASSRARLEHEDARAAVEVEVVSAVRRLDTALARQRVGAAAVDQARESQRIIRDRFEAGMAGTDDVLRASTAIVDAEARRTAAVVDTLVSRAMLERAVGRIPRSRGSL
jgi:outer membrane protein TolC